jgi:hypothetical protein
MRAGRRTQVVKGAVCKTAMQRFDPARRLQTSLEPFQSDSALASHLEGPLGADNLPQRCTRLGPVRGQAKSEQAAT